nr:hypothetical protein [Propionibacterium sp.]
MTADQPVQPPVPASPAPGAADEPGATPRPHRGRRRTLGLAAAGLVAGLGVLYGAGFALTGNTLPTGTTIAGVDVGGLTPADAEARLAEGLAARAEAPVELRAGDLTATRTPAELGLRVDHAASVAAAGGRKSANPLDMIAALAGGRAHDPVVRADPAPLAAELAELAASDRTPTDASLVYDGATPRLTPGVEGRTLRTAEAADAVLAVWPAAGAIDLPVTITPPAVTTAEAQQVLDAVAKPAVAGPVTLTAGGKTAQLGPDVVAQALTFEARDGVLQPVLNPAALASRATTQLATLGAKAPVDATVKISDGKPVVVPSVPGTGVTPDALARAVLPALTRAGADRTVALTFGEVPPAFDTAAAEAAGVKEITGEFTTVFPGTHPYRYVNIPKAAALLNNKLIKPGETFSMNDAMGGERTAAKGWAAGFGIMNGQETIQLGGGLSQITTTLYNAVFFAGLEDVEHKPHSLYFSRYPKGREATLSWPDVDLKFRNDSPYAVLLQAWTTGKPGTEGTVTVRIWSTKVYEVKQANTRITNAVDVTGEPAEDDSPDCVAQESANGFDIRYDREFWKDGQLVRSVPYFWHYNTLQPTVCTNPIALEAARARKKTPETGD